MLTEAMKTPESPFTGSINWRPRTLSSAQQLHCLMLYFTKHISDLHGTLLPPCSRRALTLFARHTWLYADLMVT